MTRLHRVAAVTGGPWCGPYALAALTGRPMEEFIPKRADGGNKHRGMSDWQIRSWLSSCGLRFEVRWIKRKDGVTRPKLWTVLRPGERGLASVSPGHLVAFDGFLVDDNHSHRKTWVFDHPYGRHGARRLYVVKAVRS